MTTMKRLIIWLFDGPTCTPLTVMLGWMQEVGVHAIVPAAVLEATPLENAVALLTLSELAAAASNGGVKLPSSATRVAVTVNGTESEDQIALLKVWSWARQLWRCQCAPPPDVVRIHMHSIPLRRPLR
jgi:hypothetical protein